MAKSKKKQQRRTLSKEFKEQIRSEYSLGSTQIALSKRYNCNRSIISRIVNGMSRDGEKLASNLATVNQELATYKQHEQHAIIQRSEQIAKIKEATLKGTNYIIGRTLIKMQGLKDDEINFNDFAQAQGVMTKADAMVSPKTAIETTTNNTQVNNITVQFVEP
jgi:transposase-like protein